MSIAYDLKINDLDILPEDELKTLRSKFQPFVKYHFVDQKIKSDAVEKLKQIRLETHFDENLLYLRDLKEWSRYPFELSSGVWVRHCWILPLPFCQNPPPVPIISSPPMIKEEAQSLPSVTTDVSPPQGVFEATADADPYPIDQQECTPLASILAQTPGLQQFQRLLRLVDYSIDDHPEKITLFAPIDQGIAKFLRAYDLKINDLDILPEDELKTLRSKFQPFVKYHFVDQKIKSDAVEKLKQIRLETHFDENLLYLRDLKEWSRYPFELIDGQGDKCKVMIADLEACEGVVHMVACMLRPDI
eukprot:TRINITY_DN10645_c0_g1_i6.p1 TRINITY_DN10645_c0_g1~~TRINITY_DN10645_c0_g1_i6.p1  ORF type:complete len:303 (-),score=61.89 TRINITY_DN10645_c0_g1_i6:652-1560(-)